MICSHNIILTLEEKLIIMVYHFITLENVKSHYNKLTNL